MVSYLNSKPFAYGLQNNSIYKKLNISLDYPSACADKLITGSADIGLVPVASIPLIPNAEIISDYCISADGKVDSVLLVSNVELQDIKEVVLDHQSMTSVLLAKLLAAELWRINPIWINETEDNPVEGYAASVVIGDRALAMKQQKNYCYDLAAEWKKLTGLPFVFACWVANKKLDADFIVSFNNALEEGVRSIDKMGEQNNLSADKLDYLKNTIQYDLNEEKRKAIEVFLGKVKIAAF